MKNFNLILCLSFLMILGSCSEDEKPDIPRGDYEKGFFITNEGPFQNGSGSISFVGEEGTTTDQVYKKVNGEDLGNIVNSMYIDGDKAYIVVNNSHKLVVADRNTMERITVLEGDGVQSPRHFVTIGQTGYLSNWGDPFDPADDFISVVDLTANEVIEKIAVGEGPERMLVVGNEVFVCLQGGYGHNNKVVVIEAGQNKIKAEVKVGDVPNSLVSDGSGSIWVLCGGIPAWTGNETEASLVEIEQADLFVNYSDFEFGQHPSLLNFEGGMFYYHLDGKVFRREVFASNLAGTALAGIEGYFYSMTVKNGELYATDPLDYASEGLLKVYDLSSGALLESIDAGIIPGGVFFD